MAMHRVVPLVASFAVGIAMAAQARVNGQLSSVLNNGLEAALVSFGSGLLIIALVIAFSRSMRRKVAAVPAVIRSGALKRWHILGGLLGAFFVAVQAASVPLIGVAVFTVAIVAGQSGNSLFVDRAGLGPAGKQPITPRRVTSAVIAVIAVGVAVANRFAEGHIAILPVALAILAGVGIAVQQAINGRVAQATESPLPATALNFAFGTAALAIGLGVSIAVTTRDAAPLPGSPWWLYLGGVLGVVFIAVAAVVVPLVGVLLFALLAIAGQLTGAVLLDLFAPTSGTELGWNLFVGVLLAFVAVAVGSRGRAGTPTRAVRESAA